MGEGEPLLMLQPPPFNNIEREWHEWEFHRLVARNRRLIRYDCRGSGSSQRNVEDFTLEGFVNDVEAVADAVGLERYNLWGETQCAPAAVAYAVRRPERVGRIVLYAPVARPADFYQRSPMRSLQSLLDQDDWRAYTDAIALAIFGWDEVAAARDMAAIYRDCADVETAKRSIQQQQTIDASPLLPQVAAPTVVLYPRGTTFPTMEMARAFASGIPRARLAIIESASYWTVASTEASLRVLDEFLEDKAREAHRVPDLAPAGIASRMPSLVTVLFTDIVGHTEMMQRMGDAKGRDVLRQHERSTRETLRQHAGVEVKTMGDGFMACFGSVSD